MGKPSQFLGVSDLFIGKLVQVHNLELTGPPFIGEANINKPPLIFSGLKKILWAGAKISGLCPLYQSAFHPLFFLVQFLFPLSTQPGLI